MLEKRHIPRHEHCFCIGYTVGLVSMVNRSCCCICNKTKGEWCTYEIWEEIAEERKRRSE